MCQFDTCIERLNLNRFVRYVLCGMSVVVRSVKGTMRRF